MNATATAPAPEHPDQYPEHEQVELIAYFLWQRRGCQPNNSLAYWLWAEKLLRNEHKNSGGKRQEVLEKLTNAFGEISCCCPRLPHKDRERALSLIQEIEEDSKHQARKILREKYGY